MSAAEFAGLKEEAIEIIRQNAPQRLQDALIALLKPAIGLDATRTDDAEIADGASKFGGAPDVPLDFEWPMHEGRPLDFMGQINLEEIAPFDIESVLPEQGLLSFFYDCANSPWGELSDWGAWRVFWFSDPILLRRQPPDRELASAPNSFSPPNSCVLTPSARWTLPGALYFYPELKPVSSDGKYGPEDEALDEILEQINYPEEYPEHFLLGQHDPVQNEMLSECVFQSRGLSYGEWETVLDEAKQWRLLWQIGGDHDADLEWGDGGEAYFFIHQDDLAKRDFSKVRFSWQCA